MNLKNDRGIAGVDIAVSLVILLIFVSLIAGLFYNISNTSKKLDKKTEATNLAINTIEKMKSMNFEELEVTGDEETRKPLSECNIANKEEISIPKGYDVEVSVEKSADNNNEKIVRVYVTYKEKNHEQEVKLETLIKLADKLDNTDVPIPNGFVVSKATGEYNKDKGLVIYEGTDDVTDENVEEAKKTRNQYVWIPVTDYETKDYDETGKTYTEDIDEASIEERKNIEESIKKYGGYFISRYEMSEKDGKAVSMQGYEPKTNITAEQAISNSRNVYDESRNLEVISTPVYGKQWDTAIEWLKENYQFENGAEYGNYSDFNRSNTEIKLSEILFNNKYNFNKSKYFNMNRNNTKINLTNVAFGMTSVDISTYFDNTSAIVPSYENTTTATLKVKVNKPETGGAYISIRESDKYNYIKSINYNFEQKDSWVKQGEYWYYKNVVEQGDIISIPIEITNNVNNTKNVQETEIDFEVAAIQASNIEVDFDAELPWGIEMSEKKNDNKIKTVSDIIVKSDLMLAYATDLKSATYEHSIKPNTKEVTGYSDSWKINNIYDFAGNVAEITAEKTGSNYIIRGGKYYYLGKNEIAKREEISTNTSNSDIGYRIALYVNRYR